MRALWQNVASGGCAIVSSTGKVPARRENNAHKRLSEEASGADVFHTALNGAAAACVRVCACSSYECKRYREGGRNGRKRPLEHVLRQRLAKIRQVCFPVPVMYTEMSLIACA